MRERDWESVQAFTHGATTPTATSTVSQGRSTRALLHGCERVISLSHLRRKEKSPRRHGNRPCPADRQERFATATRASRIPGNLQALDWWG